MISFGEVLSQFGYSESISDEQRQELARLIANFLNSHTFKSYVKSIITES